MTWSTVMCPQISQIIELYIQMAQELNTPKSHQLYLSHVIRLIWLFDKQKNIICEISLMIHDLAQGDYMLDSQTCRYREKLEDSSTH